MLDLNQRPRDSRLCSFRCSVDYAFTVCIAALRWAPSSLYTFNDAHASKLGSALAYASMHLAFAEFDAIHTHGFPTRCTTFMSPLL